MRIGYRPIIRFILFFLPAMILCVLPDVIGLTTIKEDMYDFRYGFDMTVSICFFGGIIYLVYAMFYNVAVEAKKQ